MNQNQQQSQQYGHDQTVNVDNIPVVTRIKSGSIVQETSPNSLNYNYKNQRQQQQRGAGDSTKVQFGTRAELALGVGAR